MNETTPELAIQYVDEVQPTKLSAEQLFEKLCNLHREINMLTEDAKQLLKDNKDMPNVRLINAVAKSFVKSKVGEMEEKAESLLSLLNNLREVI